MSAFNFFYKFGCFVADTGIKSPSLEKYASLMFEYATNELGVDKDLLRDEMVKDRIVTDNTGRLFGFTHVPDTNFRVITTALRQGWVQPFEKRSDKAAKGKIGFAVLYATGQVILADYTQQNPVTGQYVYKYIKLEDFLSAYEQQK